MIEEKRTPEEWLQRAEEKLAYIIIFAPDFPAEDDTNLEREFGHLFVYIERLEGGSLKAARIGWLRLARAEADEAFESYKTGEEEKGSRLLQRVEERFKSFRRGEKSRPTFIVGPDGTVGKPEDDDDKPSN